MATLLKDLGAPAWDAQLILGHASSWMTEQLYQRDDMSSRSKVEGLFARTLDNERQRSRQVNRQRPLGVEIITAILSGGPTSIFVKHLSTDNLVENLTLLYTRLVDLGMEYRDGEVYLADLYELEDDDVQA